MLGGRSCQCCRLPLAVTAGGGPGSPAGHRQSGSNRDWQGLRLGVCASGTGGRQVPSFWLLDRVTASCINPAHWQGRRRALGPGRTGSRRRPASPRWPPVAVALEVTPLAARRAPPAPGCQYHWPLAVQWRVPAPRRLGGPKCQWQCRRRCCQCHCVPVAAQAPSPLALANQAQLG